MANSDDILDDDEFYEYNPHPYTGGYDISATYGPALPPTPSTCYPISSSPAPPHSPLPPPTPTPKPAPAPSPPSAAQPRSVSPEPRPAAAPVAEPYYWPEPYNYGDAPRGGDRPMYPTPEVFRRWPYLPGPCCRSRCAPRDYWRQCMRGLDFLFGHSDGYGERRIGVDYHGVPVYANTKGGVEDAVVIEVEPPATGTLEWHDAGDEPPPASGALEWHYASQEPPPASGAVEWHYASQEPLPATGNVEWHYTGEEPPATGSVEWHYTSEEPNHSNDNRLTWDDTAKDETYAYAQPTYGSYDCSYQQSYSPDAVLDEATWFPSEIHQHAYKEESQYQGFLSSCYSENEISSQPIYCYNQHFGEQPLHVQVEPPEAVYSHKLEYHENFSTYNDQDNINNFDMSRHSYEIQPDEYVHDDAPEPFNPSMNFGYYQASTEEVSPDYETHTIRSVEYGDTASLFVPTFYPQQTQIYEQSHDDENAYLQQYWQSNWNVLSGNNCQSGDDSNHLTGSFWPFG